MLEDTRWDRHRNNKITSKSIDLNIYIRFHSSDPCFFFFFFSSYLERNYHSQLTIALGVTVAISSSCRQTKKPSLGLHPIVLSPSI